MFIREFIHNFRKFVDVIIFVCTKFYSSFSGNIENQIFTLRQILEKTHELSVDIYHSFIDFREAYDFIGRDTLLKTMEELEISTKLIKMCGILLAVTHSIFKVDYRCPEPFKLTRGFRQGVFI